MKKTASTIIAVIMALMGILWFFQGIGVVGGSFMTNQVIWAIIGPIVVVLAGVVYWFGNRPTTN
jgi:hypothetical protein